VDAEIGYGFRPRRTQAGPFVLGAVRDLTGSFTASLWLLIGFTGLLLGSAVALPARSELRANH
jgi:cyanate permease